MKIKVKKELTLPQLIEYVWNNEVSGKDFVGNRNGKVYFDDSRVTSDLVASDEIFIVEVEEEITEGTKVPKLIEAYRDSKGEPGCYTHTNKSIKYILENTKYYDVYQSNAFYILNDDMDMILIWKDGEMVK